VVVKPGGNALNKILAVLFYFKINRDFASY
jgi:hypothetical protein